MDKQRFKELYTLAHGGDMNAKADLWLEFEFAYDHDPLPAFMNPPPIVVAGGADPGSGEAPSSGAKRPAGFKLSRLRSVSPAPDPKRSADNFLQGNSATGAVHPQPPTNNSQLEGGM